MPAADVGARAFSLVSATVMLAGCWGSLPNPRSPSASDVGVYAFEASSPSSSGGVLLEGTFEVTPDTVILLLEDAQCDPAPESLAGIGYACGGASFWFERARPLRQPTASVTVSIPSRREVCHRWMETETGRHCMSWGTETTYRTERHSVRLKVTRQEPAKEATYP
ncbi:MAG TPA: hypothetical protein VLH75_17570 [Longimicrobiales bacterium]|nr:hypothetical protein [Longimicrobiales bacterium]